MVIFLVFVVLGPEGVNLGSWPNVVSPLVVGVSLALVTRGRRERAGGAERMLAEDARAPVVYLRPFGADGAEIAKRLSSRAHRAGRTLREDLRGAAGMRTAQDRPFVAVRNPAERLPLLGAARMYAADEDWRAAVGELIGRAAVVVLHAGKGDGFTWEVQHSRASSATTPSGAGSATSSRGRCRKRSDTASLPTSTRTGRRGCSASAARRSQMAKTSARGHCAAWRTSSRSPGARFGRA